MNCVVVEYVVTSDADTEDLENMMRMTPAHVVFLLYDAGEEPGEWIPRWHIANRCKTAVAAADRHFAEWYEGGAMLGHKERVLQPHWLADVKTWGCVFHFFRSICRTTTSTLRQVSQWA